MLSSDVLSVTFNVTYLKKNNRKKMFDTMTFQMELEIFQYIKKLYNSWNRKDKKLIFGDIRYDLNTLLVDEFFPEIIEFLKVYVKDGNHSFSKDDWDIPFKKNSEGKVIIPDLKKTLPEELYKWLDQGGYLDPKNEHEITQFMNVAGEMKCTIVLDVMSLVFNVITPIQKITSGKIREMFGIENKFTDLERKHIENENNWDWDQMVMKKEPSRRIGFRQTSPGSKVKMNTSTINVVKKNSKIEKETTIGKKFN